MNKLKMESVNLTEQNIDKIAELFPQVVTEVADPSGVMGEDGKPLLKKAIDFKKLKLVLSAGTGDYMVADDERERYEFTWVGKRQAMIDAATPIRKTLRPCPEESKDWESTENLYIEGDNLEVLKLLQESYLGKVKMIYIDPPYNTGKDFIYKDNFTQSREEYEEELDMFDEEGNRLFQNTETNGRFHSDWCSMIFPRLQLARNLLTDNGAIFISIDDNEVHNLKNICDEVFGEDNFIVQFVWKTDGNFDNQAKIKKCHEYILVYSKQSSLFDYPPVIDPNISQTSKLFKDTIRNTIVKNGPKNPVSQIILPKGFPCDLETGKISKQNNSWPNYLNEAVIKEYRLENEVTVSSGWSSKDLIKQFIDNHLCPIEDNKGQTTHFVISKAGAIEVIKERSTVSHVISVLQNMGGTQKATAELSDISLIGFDYPKPNALIRYLISMVAMSDDLILDFFSGSSTTAHAVMQLNAEDSGNRKFIMVQLPEVCDPNPEAAKAGYKTICEIGKERIRRAGDKIVAEQKAKNNDLFSDDKKTLDIGFRVFKLDTTNMKDVYYAAGQLSQKELFNMASNIKDDRTDIDLLYGCLLDWGVQLSMPHTTETIDGLIIHTVDAPQTDEIDLIACFDNEVSENVIRTIAKRKPLRAIFRDSSFSDSANKINVFEIFKSISPDTTVKVI